MKMVILKFQKFEIAVYDKKDIVSNNTTVFYSQVNCCFWKIISPVL